MHRRDTPHHLKNKRVQQHLSDKAANVILSKLKEMPHEVSIDESPQVEMNPMPLVQDVGLPLVDDNGYIVDVNQNGIELSANSNGEFFFRNKNFHTNESEFYDLSDDNDTHTLPVCFPSFRLYKCLFD